MLMQKYRNQILLGLLVTVAIYVAMLFLLDSQGQLTADVLDAVSRFPFSTLIFAILAQTCTFVTRFITWQYYMGVIGARDKMSVGDSLLIFVTGFVLVISPGKAAELLKAVLVKVKTGVPAARTMPVVVAERINDGISVLILLAFVLLFADSQLNLGEYRDFSRIIVFSSSLLIAGGLLAVRFRPLGELALNIIARIPFANRAHAWFRTLYESSREVFELRHVAITTLFGVGTYLFTAISFIIVLTGFGVEMNLTACLQATFIVGVGTAIGALSFVPNGAGITEISQAAMLMAIMAPEHPELTLGVAAGAAVIEGFLHKWYRVLVGLTGATLWRKRLFTPAVEEALGEPDPHEPASIQS
jgi:hypothetical protein